MGQLGYKLPDVVCVRSRCGVILLLRERLLLEIGRIRPKLHLTCRQAPSLPCCLLGRKPLLANMACVTGRGP